MLKFDIFNNIKQIPKKIMPNSNKKVSVRPTLHDDNGKKAVQDLKSKYSEEVIEALLHCLEVYRDGEDITEIIPKIINNLPRQEIPIKLITQHLVLELSRRTRQKSELVLAISPLHREVLSKKGVLRGDALKCLSDLMFHSPEIVHVLMTTLNKMVFEKNAFARKVSIYTWYKIWQLDIEEEERTQILETFRQYFFNDIPFIMGPAIYIYSLMANDEKLEFFHRLYRKVCGEILKFSPFDQAMLLELIHKYALIYFQGDKEKANGKFFQNEDLKILVKTLERVTYTQNIPSIIIASKIALFLKDEALVKRYTEALLRYMNKTSDVKFNVLVMLEEIAQKYPKLVSRYYKNFYIHQIERLYCKTIKLKILNMIVEDWNFYDIFQEYMVYAKYPNQTLANQAIQSIGKIAARNSKNGYKCIKYLVNNILGTNQFMASKSMIALSEYLSTMSEEKMPILAFCIANLSNIESTEAKVKLLNLLIQNIGSLKTLGLKAYHSLVINFPQNETKLKLRTLELGIALSQHFKQNETFTKINNLCLEFGSFDDNVSIRDFAKFQKGIQERNVELDLESLNLSKRVPENQEAVQNSNVVVGSLSKLAGYRLRGALTIPKVVVKENTAHLRDQKNFAEQDKQQQKAQEEEIRPSHSQEEIDKEINTMEKNVEKQLQISKTASLGSQDGIKSPEKDEKYFKDLKQMNDDFFDD